MADGRMKAVVDYDSSMDGDDEVGRVGEDEEDFVDLELGLSLGRCGWKGGTAMDGGRREWFPQWDQNVGSSRFFERQGAASQAFPHKQPDPDPTLRFWGEDLMPTAFARVGEGMLRFDDVTISDIERYTQHKRPKVLAFPE